MGPWLYRKCWDWRVHGGFYLCVCAQSCPALCHPVDCSLSGSSVHGISQARILEWVSISPTRGVFPIQGSNPCLLYLLRCMWMFYSWATGEARVAVRGMSCLKLFRKIRFSGRLPRFWPLYGHLCLLSPCGLNLYLSRSHHSFQASCLLLEVNQPSLQEYTPPSSVHVNILGMVKNASLFPVLTYWKQMSFHSVFELNYFKIFN